MDMLYAIRTQIEALQRKIDGLQQDIAELHVAERVVARLTPASQKEPSTGNRGSHPPRQTDLIVQTLHTLKANWVADWAALQKAIAELHGTMIPKSSLQPYLSNLKNENIIVRDGSKIALRERVAKGAGPQSDNSYDPETAAAETDDDDRPQQTMMRIRQPQSGIRRLLTDD